MDKNTITGFVLIALVLIGFSWYSQPSAEEVAQMQEVARQDSIQQAKQAEAAQKAEEQKALALAMKAQDSTALFFEARNAQGEEVTIGNGLVNITLNTKGGSIQSASLTQYKNQQKEDVQLLRKGMNSLSYQLVGKDDNIDTRDYTFQAINRTDSTVTMRLGNETSHLDINYHLVANSYLVKISMQATGMGSVLHPGTESMTINWQDVAAQQEKGFDFENNYSSLTYKEKGEGVDNLSETGNESEKMETALDWVAFKNQFFSCILIGHQDFTDATLQSIRNEKPETAVRYESVLKHFEASMQTAFDINGAQPTQMQMYMGPNDFHILKDTNKQGTLKTDLELEDIIYFGWPLFKWINRFFILYLFDWLNGWGLPMGIVLLLLTLIVKVLVYPTTKKSYMSSAKMRVLKPQIDALSQKYPKQEDAMKKQQEMMQIYSQYGVSPMGGCLPMLLQTPIWIALFNFLPNAIELRGESFLWADDLSAYDDVISWGKNLWLIGDHLSIFCLLFCLTNIINTWISMRQQQNQMSGEQAQQMKMMQYMMYVMPLMFFFMFNNYSSGLCYYYFLSGLSSVLIMWFLRKTTDDAKLLAKLEAYRQQHKNDPKKMSGLAARLEALQKMQEEQARMNAKR